MSDITVLSEYRAKRNASDTLATVLTDTDPHNPDHAWHLVVHETKEAVQSQVTGLFTGVESFGAGGEGHCHCMSQRDGLYFAIVETLRYRDV